MTHLISHGITLFLCADEQLKIPAVKQESMIVSLFLSRFILVVYLEQIWRHLTENLNAPSVIGFPMKLPARRVVVNVGKEKVMNCYKMPSDGLPLAK